MLKSPLRAVKKAAFYFVKKGDNRSINWLDNDQIRQALRASASFLISGSEVIHGLFQCNHNADVMKHQDELKSMYQNMLAEQHGLRH
jgi:hypothetical protein